MRRKPRPYQYEKTEYRIKVIHPHSFGIPRIVEYFDCVRDVCEKYNFERVPVMQVLNRKQYTHRKFQFSYVK